MKQLKRIDFNEKVFVANGTTYFIESQMSVDRWRLYQVLEKEAAFSTTFSAMFSELKELHELMNNIQFVKAAVKLDNLMSGLTKLKEKEPTLLRMAALFINTEDEDRVTITNDRISKKIDDWAKEYDIRDFFHFALNTIHGFMDFYKKDIPDTSQIIGL